MSNRARKERGLRKPAEVPLDTTQAASRFIRMRGRSVEVYVIPIGVSVKADTPEELERETNREIIRRTEGSRSN